MNRSMFLSLSLVTMVLACQGMGKQATPGQTGQAVPQAPAVATSSAPTLQPVASAPVIQDEVVAVVNGTTITDSQVRDAVAGRIKKVEAEIYEIKMAGLKGMVDELLLKQEATKRQLEVKDLVQTEVTSKVTDPAEEDIKKEYEGNKARRYRGQTLEQARTRIINGLRLVQQRELKTVFLADLRKQADISIKMEVPRVEVGVDDDPAKGPKDAQITLIEFSDFQCPFCRRTRDTITKILATYGDKVHYVFRDFPLSFHDKAFKAAEATNCAGEQDRYWDYNTLLWERQGALELEQLKQYAVDLGLDAKKFNECLDASKYADEINKDMDDGQAAGVSGTPAYFINGISLSGARPFEDFQEVIEAELARK